MTAVTIYEPVTLALGYASVSRHRDRAWQIWVDGLLDQRLRLTA